ncbi:formyltetrahydrofolate deformylase [Rhodovulum sp. BSW8]|uniref:Formyltetrahydrofolate deformylase n=1 Tax=Rhodovulum visakhapatnamense TaxID=364297 RepID=A0A4R8FZR4_9RHOB|nr:MULTISPECIES: formyltetrahydrofolate deformylase [Rhodovulum]OLS44538.1 formyltetrahydrofolate deformylase [Rhodovulum sulfidophilum]MBL3570492.1 formyltetrahydrofolate deformylase [Rhodovulum visakhapatnamense]MBL3578027.1 formyltetrahydrofolate deformylase [Rhodovulum visakhapatnamense]RBO53458.1 formyltetrahydrofolate deformylase [Rhodovulum sp. BSW8]TDX28235.1 formyltetrahydrofolate deformylase [Rhodovulum visakhapatnamense]
MASTHFILTLTCDDQPGIVATVANAVTALGGNIQDSAQFRDPESNRFFMRVAFHTQAPSEAEAIRARLAPAINGYGMDAEVVDAERRPKIILMVSKFDHALLHILYQIRVGWMEADVVAVVSNHEDSRATAEAAGIPYYCWPVTKDTKAEQERKVLDLVEETGAELVVLARYMQVLSDKLSRALSGRVINIHHSFLPSFKGAKPYHQAHERGVKLIGATAHFVTADLDEGPIIEQETERVNHALSAEDYVAVGRDIESRVLARAVRLHLQRRVLLNGHKTVVFMPG